MRKSFPGHVLLEIRYIYIRVLYDYNIFKILFDKNYKESSD